MTQTFSHGRLASTGLRFAGILPLAFITYSLAFLDRTNFSFGVSGGMGHDLGIDDTRKALLNAVFFVGYLLFQIPGAYCAAKHSVRWLIFGTLVLWGMLSACTGVLSNFWGLMAARFSLGAVEGVVLPAMLVYLTHWFTKAERSRANTFLILGNPVTMIWGSILSGYLIAWLGWRFMFVFEGLPSILWAFVWIVLARDYPRDSRWLTSPQIVELEAVIDAEQQGLGEKNYWAAFADWRVIVLSVQYLVWGIGLYGFTMWLPTLISEGSRQESGLVGLLSALPWALAVVLMIVASTFSDRTRRRKIFVWPFLLVSAAAFFVSAWAGPNRFWLSYACLVVAGGTLNAPWGPFWAIIPEMVPRKVAGESMALINSCGALGGFLGTYLVGWLRGYTHSQMAGYALMSGSMAAAGILVMLVPTKEGSVVTPTAAPGLGAGAGVPEALWN